MPITHNSKILKQQCCITFQSMKLEYTCVCVGLFTHLLPYTYLEMNSMCNLYLYFFIVLSYFDTRFKETSPCYQAIIDASQMS